jgi:hypothetical protein
MTLDITNLYTNITKNYNKCLWDYNFKVIATGFSDHYAQILGGEEI